MLRLVTMSSHLESHNLVPRVSYRIELVWHREVANPRYSKQDAKTPILAGYYTQLG